MTSNINAIAPRTAAAREGYVFRALRDRGHSPCREHRGPGVPIRCVDAFLPLRETGETSSTSGRVGVFDDQSNRIGYVSCECNEVIARLLDGGKSLSARFCGERIASVGGCESRWGCISMISQASALGTSALVPSSGYRGFSCGVDRVFSGANERSDGGGGKRGASPGRRRARQVSAFERACAFVFGSPSLRRANGGAEASFAPSHTGSAAKRRLETPVFEIDRRGVDAAGVFRAFGFPSPVFVDPTEPSTVVRSPAFTLTVPIRLEHALDLANRYLGEAHACESSDHVRRCACFRAAEILLLHAAERRNVEAYELLAWIYEHDACEGVYWASELELRAAHGSRLSRAARALEWRAKRCLAGTPRHAVLSRG